MKHFTHIILGFTVIAMLSAPGSALAAVAPPPTAATITVRNGSTIVWSGPVALNSDSSTTTPVSPIPADSSTHDVPANSVLALLTTADAAQEEFDISDLQFNSSFGSFYLNCITVPESLCANWQYAVTPSGGSLTNPGVGMDVTTLSVGDAAYVYFGSSRRITPSATSLSAGGSLTVTAETYDPSTDTYSPATGATIGLIQGDPFGAFTTVSSSPADAEGKATFTIADAGSYVVGVAEDFYFPNATITVSAAAPAPAPAPAPASSGGGGGGISLHAPFDIPAALAFIARMQHADGSFDSLLLSDWAALAVAGGSAGDAKVKLAQYFTANPPVLSSVSDYERHAMALEALGIDPYSGTSVDYIAPIVAGFDGTQVGDPSLVNDDVFALFPLLHAGYGASEDIIAKTAVFIMSKQRADGSWEGSVDLTAAAIQALSLVRELPGAPDAVTRGINYLRAQQKADGGFGNSFSTSWALQAIAALSGSSIDWAQSGLYTPQYYLATLQETDGGVEVSSTDAKTRLWATAYAIPGIQGKTWDALLTSFTKPSPVLLVAVSTSTPESATSTAAEAGEVATVIPAPSGRAAAAVIPDTPATSDATTSTSTSEENPQVAAAATTGAADNGWNAWMYAVLLLLLLILAGVLGERWWRKHRERKY